MHDPGSTCCNTETAVLHANGLRKTYGGRPVVDGVSITVQPREIVGLLGPNGAGKTTSFYMIAGLIPADAGTVHFNGHDMSHMPMHRRARLGLGYLPQEESIFRKLSVLDNLLAILETRPKLSRADRADFLLTQIEDEQFVEQMPMVSNEAHGAAPAAGPGPGPSPGRHRPRLLLLVTGPLIQWRPPIQWQCRLSKQLADW